MRLRRLLIRMAAVAALATPLAAAADDAGAPSPDAGAVRPAPDGKTILPVDGSARKALAEQLSPWMAFVIGAVGSCAYLIATWVGLVGSKDGKLSPVLDHFTRWWAAKVGLYLASGGAVAMVFQLPEGKLIPVQAFIIGCTWPAVVSNYLSGRQSGDLPGAPAAAGAAANLAVAQEIKSSVPPVPASKADAASQLDEIVGSLPDVPPAGGAAPGGAPGGAPP